MRAFASRSWTRFSLPFSLILFSLTFFVLGGISPALGQSVPVKSFWLNPGDGLSPVFDPDLGEFDADIGGLVEFGRYRGGHPYESIRVDLERFFFDPDELDTLLGGLQAPVVQPMSSGDYSVYYLDHDVHYETMVINGAHLSLIWDPTNLTTEPCLLINLQSSFGPHSGPNQFVLNGSDHEPSHGRTTPSDHFDGRPLEPAEQAVAQGHYLAVLTPNRWPDIWVALQRLMDVIRYITDRGDIDYYGAYAQGGSWEGNQSCKAALFMPRIINGAIGPSFLDMAYESPHGAWSKLLTSFYTALGRADQGVAVPARTHSVEGSVFSHSGFRVSDLHLGWEYAAYSIFQRAGLTATERLQRPIRWYMGNCDIYHNPHFYMDALRNDPALQAYTASIGTLQLLGHGGEAAGPNNNQYFFSGTEIQDIIDDPSSLGPTTNPTVNPKSLPPPDDPYFRDIYAHTVLDTPSEHEWLHPGLTSPLLSDAPWHPVAPATDPTIQGPLGCGVWPGAFDAIHVGDVDGDSRNEVIFGNFDGFVEVLEERFSGLSSEPILVPESRSPPVGWNVQALDVGTLTAGGDRWIVFGSANGVLNKIRIRPSGGVASASYSFPDEFIDPSEPEANRPHGGFLQFLHIGDFDPGSSGFEVLVQDEFFVWFLYDSEGRFLAKTDRGVDPSGLPDGFDPGSGKPWVGHFPFHAASGALSAFLPGIDGRLRHLRFDGTQRLALDVVSDDYTGVGRCASFFDPGDGNGPYILVGAEPGRGADHSTDADNGHALTLIDPRAPAGQTILAQYSGAPTYDFDVISSIVPRGGGEFLVAFRDRLMRIQVSIDGQGQASIDLVTGPGSEVVIPGADNELCSVQAYTSLRQDRYLVSTFSGRFWILENDLTFARTTATLERPGGTDPVPWYSNRSFGYTFMSDQREDADQAIWIDDLGLPHHKASGNDVARLARLLPETGVLDDWHLTGRGSLDILGMDINQSNGGRQYFVENGAFGTLGSGTYSYTLLGPVEPRGGYIQQIGSTLSILQNFDVPIDDDFHESFTNGANETTPWPYAEEPRYHGQVTQAVLQGQRPYGNTVKTAQLRKNPGDSPELHVVVGTVGGYVYAVDPDAPSDGLSFHTPDDLGWGVIGLDVGDVDGDGRNEVVAGTWMDTAGLTEVGDSSRHRGHLYVLDPSTPGPFGVTEIDITVPDRFGAGVWGIALDDIDGNGTLEIWVTDARGYLHALRRDGQGGFECFYRTRGLGMYAGMYNKIWPFKSGSGQTTHLVVQTPGYIYRFAVDPTVVQDG